MIDAQRIIESLPDSLLVLGEDLVVRDINPAFSHTFAVRPDTTIGTPIYELAGGGFNVPSVRGALRDLVEEEASFKKVEVELPLSDDGSGTFELSGRVLVAGEGDSDKVLLMLRDITARKKLEVERRHHAARLARSNRDLEEFARVASHDLQEPLRMISNYLQLLDRRYREHLPGTAREFIDYAVDGAERMKSLVNGLLQYSRVGRKEDNFRIVNLDEILDGVLRDLSQRMEEKQATVTREQLPPTFGNPGQIPRVFQNLIENALVYAGEAPPRIHVKGNEEGDGVHLVVRDEGMGIPEDGQEKIFGIFNQVDPHGTGRDGSGIGLALCNRIVERHEGTMWVDSELGEGSAFHFTFHLSPQQVS